METLRKLIFEKASSMKQKEDEKRDYLLTHKMTTNENLREIAKKRYYYIEITEYYSRDSKSFKELSARATYNFIMKS